VHGDARKMLNHDGQPIIFAEWGYLGKGKFNRRDFRLDMLTQMSAFPLFTYPGKYKIFKPTKTYPPMTVNDLVTAALGDTPKDVP